MLRPTPFLFAALAAFATLQTKAKAPNVLLFLVDDLGWSDLSCQGGGDFYETPSADRLAKEGERFTDAYVAYPRCLPSRFSIYTGKFPQRAKVPPVSDMPASETTFAEALAAGGYRTFFAGKWHLSHNASELPQAQGFSVNIGGGAAGATASHFAPYDVPARQKRSDKKEKPVEGLGDAPKGEYLADRLTAETEKFIRAHEAAKSGKPFLAVLSHYGVHTPIEAPAADVAPFVAKTATASSKGPAYIARDGETKAHRDNAAYAGMVRSVDRSLGRLLAVLDELKLADDTLVIFTSDNGGLSNRGGDSRRELATSNLPLRAGKGHLYEGGVRVPFIVRWPGRAKPGSVTSSVVSLVDIYPTLLEAAGLPLLPEQHRDGASFLPVLKGGNVRRAPLVWHNIEPRPGQTGDHLSSAIRDGDLKLVHFYEGNTDELYDLSKDIGENNDLSKTRPADTKALRDALFAALKAEGAFMPGDDKTEIRRLKRAARDDSDD